MDYVVTGLKIVVATTLEEALDKRQRGSKYVTAGIDMTLNDSSCVVQPFCRRSNGLRHALQHRLGAA